MRKCNEVNQNAFSYTYKIEMIRLRNFVHADVATIFFLNLTPRGPLKLFRNHIFRHAVLLCGIF